MEVRGSYWKTGVLLAIGVCIGVFSSVSLQGAPSNVKPGSIQPPPYMQYINQQNSTLQQNTTTEKTLPKAEFKGTEKEVLYLIRRLEATLHLWDYSPSDNSRVLLTHLKKLHNITGWSAWQRQVSTQLTDSVQQVFQRNQNPPDCKTAKRFRCLLNHRCGFACTIHHLIMCVNLAMATGRVAVLDTKGWSYPPETWNTMFLPFSEKCTSLDLTGSNVWTGSPEKHMNDTAPIIVFPPTFLPGGWRFHPNYPVPTQRTPLIFPDQLKDRLLQLNGETITWWAGQLVKYIMRPQPAFQAKMDAKQKEMGFLHPIVGVHIRRSDKVSTHEAAAYGLEAYMAHVARYYDQLELEGEVKTKRVFMTTDEPKVLEEAKKKYPQYTYIYNKDSLKASTERFSKDSTFAIVMDIHFLALSNHVVCTMSSNVGRLVQEMRSYMFPDSEHRLISLDEEHLQWSKNYQKAIFSHKPTEKGHLEFLKGDQILFQKVDSAKGLYYGYNVRTKASGFYPASKAVFTQETTHFLAFGNKNL